MFDYIQSTLITIFVIIGISILLQSDIFAGIIWILLALLIRKI